MIFKDQGHVQFW